MILFVGAILGVVCGVLVLTLLVTWMRNRHRWGLRCSKCGGYYAHGYGISHKSWCPRRRM